MISIKCTACKHEANILHYIESHAGICPNCRRDLKPKKKRLCDEAWSDDSRMVSRAVDESSRAYEYRTIKPGLSNGYWGGGVGFENYRRIGAGFCIDEYDSSLELREDCPVCKDVHNATGALKNADGEDICAHCKLPLSRHEPIDKTVLGWLETLPAPYRDYAIRRNAEEGQAEKLGCDCTSLYEAICSQGFVGIWSKTVEGSYFWHDIAAWGIGEELPELPDPKCTHENTIIFTPVDGEVKKFCADCDEQLPLCLHEDTNYGAKCNRCGEVRPLTEEMAEFCRWKGKKIVYFGYDGKCRWGDGNYVIPTGEFVERTLGDDVTMLYFKFVDQNGKCDKMTILVDGGHWDEYKKPKTMSDWAGDLTEKQKDELMSSWLGNKEKPEPKPTDLDFWRGEAKRWEETALNYAKNSDSWSSKASIFKNMYNASVMERNELRARLSAKDKVPEQKYKSEDYVCPTNAMLINFEVMKNQMGDAIEKIKEMQAYISSER